MRSRLPFAFAVALATASLLAAACARVADLDIAYNEPSDGGHERRDDQDGGAVDASTGTADGALGARKVRDSSVDGAFEPTLPPPPPTNLGPCDAGLGTAAGCDETAGLGCCVTSSGSKCMEQREVAASCSGKVFIACVQGNGDSACCWRTVGATRMAVYAGDCDGGKVACQHDAECPEGQGCALAHCGPVANPFDIGQCGATPPGCPQ